MQTVAPDVEGKEVLDVIREIVCSGQAKYKRTRIEFRLFLNSRLLELLDDGSFTCDLRSSEARSEVDKLRKWAQKLETHIRKSGPGRGKLCLPLHGPLADLVLPLAVLAAAAPCELRYLRKELKLRRIKLPSD